MEESDNPSRQQTDSSLVTGAGKDKLALPSYDELPPADRKQWLDRLIGRPLHQAGKPLRKAKDESGGNYRYYFINSDYPGKKQYFEKFDHLNRLLHRNNSGRIMGYLRDHPEMLSEAQKIHIQPGADHIFEAAQDLTELLIDNDNVYKAVESFKVIVDHLYALTTGMGMTEPAFVIYLYPGTDTTMVKAALGDKFSDYEPVPDKDIPRFNQRDGNVIFSAEGEGYFKALLQRDKLLDRYYDKSTNYARVKQDVQHAPPPAINRLISLLRRSRP